MVVGGIMLGVLCAGGIVGGALSPVTLSFFFSNVVQ